MISENSFAARESKNGRTTKCVDIVGGNFNYVAIGEKKYVLPNEWRNTGDRIYNFQQRSNDIFVMTLPRSGTTLTQELVWLLVNNLDFDNAKKFTIEERAPTFE